ncbi:hypothetical protein [Rodentibacter pneumotropicus]|nr:hypothetical protein [Rodentibacter pneumotropicus]
MNNKNHQQGYAIEFLGAHNEPLAHCYIELSINGYPVSESPLRADEHGRFVFHPSLVEQNGKSLPIKIVFWHEQYPKTVHSEVPEFSWINGKRVVRLRAYNVYEITPRAIPNENNEPATYKRPYHLVKQGETWDVIEKEAGVNRYALQWENGLDEATPLDTLVGKKIYFPRGTRKLKPTPKTPSTTSGKSENKQANKKASSVPKQQKQKAEEKKAQNQVIQARSESNGKPIDTVNKSCPEECKVTEIIIFKTSKGNYIISKELWDFILNIEKYVATPYVPSNGIDGKSGVTLGYGYDLGQQTKKQCMMNYLNFIHLSN